MSASFQALPPPGPPPPGTVYPTVGTSAEGQDNTHPSTGSFGMVFIVLAIILVISAIACVLGRFCSKKSHKTHNPRVHKQGHGNGHNHFSHHQNHNDYNHGGIYPRDRDLEFGFRSKEGDIMSGFEPDGRGPSTAKVANHGDFRGDSMGRGMEHVGEHGDFP